MFETLRSEGTGERLDRGDCSPGRNSARANSRHEYHPLRGGNHPDRRSPARTRHCSATLHPYPHPSICPSVRASLPISDFNRGDSPHARVVPAHGETCAGDARGSDPPRGHPLRAEILSWITIKFITIDVCPPRSRLERRDNPRRARAPPFRATARPQSDAPFFSLFNLTAN
jgi:predicted protein tyrosine phosphatase